MIHGHGWCVFLFFIGGIQSVRLAREEWEVKWPACIFAVFSALLLARIGYLMNRRVTAFDSLGNAITHKPYHAFMYIPVEYWSLFLLGSGLENALR